MRITCIVLVAAALTAPVRADSPDDPVRTAIEKGLHRLEEGRPTTRKTASASAAITRRSRWRRSIRPGGTASPWTRRLRRQIDFTLDTFRPQREKIAKGQAVGGTTTLAGYALFTLEMGGSPPDEVSAALVEYLLARQRPDGAWPVQSNRPPMQAGDFTPTYLALRALKAYGPHPTSPGVGGGQGGGGRPTAARRCGL